MSLRCDRSPCKSILVQQLDQLAFRKDEEKGEWHLTLRLKESEINWNETELPLVLATQTNPETSRIVRVVQCKFCSETVGTILKIAGFHGQFVTFLPFLVSLYATGRDKPQNTSTRSKLASKWEDGVAKNTTEVGKISSKKIYSYQRPQDVVNSHLLNIPIRTIASQEQVKTNRQNVVVEVNDFNDGPTSRSNKCLQLDFFKFNSVDGLKQILHEINNQMMNVNFTDDQEKITARFYHGVSVDGLIQRIPLSDLLMSISNLSKNFGVSSWINVPFNEPPGDYFKFHFDQLTTFYFNDRHNVLLEEPISEHDLLFFEKKDQFVIEMSVPFKVGKLNREVFEKQRFTIDKTIIDRHIMINETANSVDIYLCLRQPPETAKTGPKWGLMFQDRSFNLCLRRFSTYPRMNMMRASLRNTAAKVYHIVNVNEKYHKFESQPVENFDRFCLINHWKSKYAAVLPPKLPKDLLSALKSMPLNRLESLLLNTEPERFEELKLAEVDENTLKLDRTESFTFKNDQNYKRIASITITPTRIIYNQFAMVAPNRVLRMYQDNTSFALVDFAKEVEGSPWTEDDNRDLFKSFMLRGFNIAGRTYNFLGNSNSQLREGKGRCWFSCLNREEVYKEIGDLSNFTNAGRKLTRLAMAFASSKETVRVDHAKYLQDVSDDVMGGRDGTTKFSDGIGRGSEDLFLQMTEKLGLETVPSAFQIRIGGIKGVISMAYQEDLLTIRKSMKKFPSNHNMIEVVNYNRPFPLYLNRLTVLILSHFGVKDEVFFELQQVNLRACINAMVASRPQDALKFIKLKSFVAEQWINFAEKIVVEPFFKEIVRHHVIDTISQIANKVKIKVDEGRVLMGVLDETGILNYNQVYVHIVEDDLDIELDCDIVLFRCPCVLPSDIRHLRATSKVPAFYKELYKNVVVMPAKGPDSHANECAGGDLDGDVYSVIWDKRLIPVNLPIPGVPVPDFKTSAEPDEQVIVDTEQMIDFFCNFQQQNRLGTIANAHLALVDTHGIDSPQALAIAEFVVAETDAPVKGLTVGNKFRNLMPNLYPHYMGKRDRESYRSPSIVGKLYDSVLALTEIVQDKVDVHRPKKYVSTTEDTLSADYWYSVYCDEINRALDSFGLTSEMDLFSGIRITKKTGYKLDEKKESLMLRSLNDVMKDFWERWVKIFENYKSQNNDNQDKIREWYNLPKLQECPACSFSFLALPFMTTNDDEVSSTIANSVHYSIRSSIKDWITFCKIDWVGDWAKRKSTEERICEELGAIPCGISGVSYLGLNEEFADLNFYSNCGLAEVASSLRNIDGNDRKRRKTNLNSAVTLSLDSHTIMITNNKIDILRVNSIADFLDRNMEVWTALRVLLEWARTNKIVESGGSEGLMTTEAFILLFIEYSHGKPIDVAKTFKLFSLDRLRDWMEAYTDESIAVNCALIIFKFLQKISRPKNNSLTASRVDPITGENLIDSDAVEDLRQSAEYALFVLSAHDGDINRMLQYSTRHRVYWISTDLLNEKNSTPKLKEQILRDIRKKSFIDESSQLTLISKSENYLLDVSSKHHREFLKIQDVLDAMQKRLNYSNREISKVTNSMILIPEYSYGDSTDMNFTEFEGINYHPNHANSVRSKAETQNDMLNLDWMSTEYDRYKEKFMSQNGITRSSGMDDTLKCSIQLGSQYFINTPESLLNVQEFLTLKRIEMIILGSDYRETSFRDANNNVQHVQRMPKVPYSRNRVFHRNVTPTRVYNRSLKIFTKTDSEPKNDIPVQPLKLSQIKTVTRVTQGRKRKRDELDERPAPQMSSTKASSELDKLSYAFFSNTTLRLEKLDWFAKMNGFKATNIIPTKVLIHATCNKLEVTITTDRFGIVQAIQHSKARWLSATLMRYKMNDSDDVRINFDTEKKLSRDENSLCAYFKETILFNTDFIKAITANAIDHKRIPSAPMNSEIISCLDFRLHNMKIQRCISRYENCSGDILEFNEVFDGAIDSDRKVDWFEKRNELKIDMSTIREPEDLCQSSFDMGLRIFNFSKSANY